MSSSETRRANPTRAYNDIDGLSLEQTVPHLVQNSTRSLRSNGKLSLAFENSDGDHRAEDRAPLEARRGKAVTARVNNRPSGCFGEFNDGPTGADHTNKVGTPDRDEQDIPRASPEEILAGECSHPTAGGPTKFEYKPSRAMATSQLQRPNCKTKASPSARYKPLVRESKADSGDDACLTAAACEKFQERMLHIPEEICQMIMDMVFEEAFGPRRVHPHKDPPIMNIFLSLDRELYRKFHQQYWTKNTWVVSKGPLNKTMRFMTEKPYNDATTEFSLQIPNKAALRIRFAELSFSNVDTPNLSEWRQLASQIAAAPIVPSSFNPQPPREAQSLQCAQRDAAGLVRAQRCDEIQRQLIHTWQDKFDRIAMLNLRHLTLDFTEACDPSGSYLGVYIVRRLIPFAHGIPGEFKIVTPNNWLERQTREAFLVLNAG